LLGAHVVAFQNQLRQALDGEQRLAQLVVLLGGEPTELGQAARRRQQLAQALGGRLGGRRRISIGSAIGRGPSGPLGVIHCFHSSVFTGFSSGAFVGILRISRLSSFERPAVSSASTWIWLPPTRTGTVAAKAPSASTSAGAPFTRTVEPGEARPDTGTRSSWRSPVGQVTLRKTSSEIFSGSIGGRPGSAR